MTLLQDPDKQIRDRAAQVLGQFNDAGSVTPLGATLRAETLHMTNLRDVTQGQRDWEKAMETSPRHLNIIHCFKRPTVPNPRILQDQQDAKTPPVYGRRHFILLTTG